MESAQKPPTTIDEYIETYPEEIQSLLEIMRQTIKTAAPEASETISYGMPAFRQKHILAQFGVGKHHIGLYPTPSAIAAFQDRLSAYKSGKGSVQFPLDQPLPVELITDIIKYRVEEDSKK